jgi:hypothetical protein
MLMEAIDEERLVVPWGLNPVWPLGGSVLTIGGESAAIISRTDPAARCMEG